MLKRAPRSEDRQAGASSLCLEVTQQRAALPGIACRLRSGHTIYTCGSVLRSPTPSVFGVGNGRPLCRSPRAPTPSVSRTLIFPSSVPLSPAASLQHLLLYLMGRASWEPSGFSLPGHGVLGFPECGWDSLPPQAGSTPGRGGTRLLMGAARGLAPSVDWWVFWETIWRVDLCHCHSQDSEQLCHNQAINTVHMQACGGQDSS